ncbi:MAG: type IV pilin-like G/H family protein [Myxococcaceae bacterium]|nr:type IV pilin-like G/H family protein [Myxococcaceae bacterium]
MKTSKAAVASLVLGILGLCLLIPAPLALIFGLVAYVNIGRDPQLQGKGLATAGIVLSACAVFTAGVLAAIAIPAFMKFGARAKEAEARTSLKALWVAQKAYQAEHGAFTEDRTQLGWVPEERRYRCALTAEELQLLPPDDRAAIPASIASTLGATKDHFTAVCSGNIDNDPARDVWAVSDAPLPALDGMAEGGVPAHLVDDL